MKINHAAAAMGLPDNITNNMSETVFAIEHNVYGDAYNAAMFLMKDKTRHLIRSALLPGEQNTFHTYLVGGQGRARVVASRVRLTAFTTTIDHAVARAAWKASS
jgi:hypothetical protein